MAYTPVKGKFAKITDNASPTPHTFPGVNWTLSIDPKLEDSSNFRDGRRATDTLTAAEVSLTLIYDEDMPPDDGAVLNLIAGQNVTVKLYVNNAQTRFWTLVGRIGKVDLKNEGVEKLVKYDVKIQQDGALTPPA